MATCKFVGYTCDGKKVFDVVSKKKPRNKKHQVKKKEFSKGSQTEKKVYLTETFNLMTLPQYVEGDEFDHLPHNGKIARRPAGSGRCERKHDYDRAWAGVVDHSKSCRKSRIKRTLRSERANTHRQMDNILMAETNVWDSDGRMTAEAYLDGHGEVLDIQEHLDEVNEAIGVAWVDQDEPDHKWFWDTAEGMFIMDEASQNCHGFNGDTFEEEALASNADYLLGAWDSMDDYYDLFYDDPHYEDSIDYEEERRAEDDRLYQQLIDMEPTQEEWDVMDDLLRAEEADQDQFEQRFEHLPMSNATGTKARLGQCVLIDA